jgi:hypothetical protein
MACVIAQVAADGVGLRAPEALDRIVDGFLGWFSDGPRPRQPNVSGTRYERDVVVHDRTAPPPWHTHPTIRSTGPRAVIGRPARVLPGIARTPNVTVVPLSEISSVRLSRRIPWFDRDQTQADGTA